MCELGAYALRGVQLGKMERDLLLRAPSPEAAFGLVLDHLDRSLREQLRQAAAKLEREGLLERDKMRCYVRARDPRQDRLLFRDGGFWRPRDPSRAQAVRRNVVWKSPFGFEIALLYRAQLAAAGTKIRWETRAVERAQARARTHHVDRELRRGLIATREEDEADALVRARGAGELAYPSFQPRCRRKATPSGGSSPF
jgi:hypothetical protein